MHWAETWYPSMWIWFSLSPATAKKKFWVSRINAIQSSSVLTCYTNCDKLRSKRAVRWETTWIWVQVLKVPGKNAFLSGKKERVNATQMLHFSRQRLVIQQVREDPSDFFQAENSRHFLNFSFLWIFQQFDCVLRAFLRWLVDCNDSCTDSKRNVSGDLVGSVKEANALMSSVAPVVQELIDDTVVLKHHVVDMSVSLTVQRDCRWLALRADTFGPWRMLTTTGFYLALDVFERDVLSAIHARRLLAQVCVKREMLDLLLFEIALVVRFNWRAVNTSTVVGMAAKLLIFLPLNTTIEFKQFNVDCVFN